MDDSRIDPRSAIRVCCRFRPLNKIELKQGSRCGVLIPENQNTSVSLRTLDAASYTFAFDRVFGTNATQREVFIDSALPIVDDVLEGYNGCLLAYGQTGAGKTHTMMGPSIEDENEKGILPRVIEHIFDFAAKADESVEFTVKCSMVEIYLERIRDLLDASRDNLQVKEDPLCGVYIAGCTEEYVTSVEETFEIMRKGDANRAVAATGMNEGSSRSHSLFVITLSQKDSKSGITKTGRFFLVDLAGSETINKTGVTGQQLEEAKKINKSLSALGNVINALTDGKSTHVPYRDSKLTRVLQEALGGNSRTALIINCSPASYNEMETLSTLRFGKRAKKISNHAKANKERTPEEMRRYIEVLEQQLDAYKVKEKAWLEGGGVLPTKQKPPVGGDGRSGSDEDDDDMRAPPSPAPTPAEAKPDTGSAVEGAVGEEEDGLTKESLVQKNDELTQYVNMLTEVLTEASTEITTLKEKLAEVEQELEERRAGGAGPASATASTASAVVPSSDSEGPAAATMEHVQAPVSPPRPVAAVAASGDDHGTLSPGKAEIIGTVKTLQAELHALRENYHRAMERNEALQSDIEELQAQVAAAEDAKAGARAGSASALLAEVHDSSIANALGSSSEIFVVLENERYFPLSGWSSSTLGTDRPNFSDATGVNYCFKDDVDLPGDDWYWLNEWEIQLSPSVDGQGWSYGDSFAALDGGKGSSVDTFRAVRSRRWLRAAAQVMYDTTENARAHLLTMLGRMKKLETQLGAFTEFNAKLAEELQTRQTLVTEYEAKITALQTAMALSAATGDLKYIGEGISDRMGGGASHVRSIRGGGGAKHAAAAAATKKVAAMTSPLASPPPNAAGVLNTPDGEEKAGFFSSLRNKLTFTRGSPATAAPPKPAPAAAAAAAGSGGAADLFKAAEAGNVAEMVRLVKAGSKVGMEDKSGRTPLLYAARGGQLAAVTWLVEQGAELDAMDKEGRNALHYAARRGHVDVAGYLLDHGISVWQTDVHALTPLHQATLGKSRAMCELMLQKGADLYCADANGHTALDLASRFEGEADAAMADTIAFLKKWAEDHPQEFT